MFNFGKENFGGAEQSEQVKNVKEIMSKALSDCRDGDIEERLKNNQENI